MDQTLAKMYQKVGRDIQFISGVLLWASVYHPFVDEWYTLKVTGLMIALSSSNLLLQKGYKMSCSSVSLQKEIKEKKKL